MPPRRCVGLADTFGDLRVTPRFSEGNLAELLPDALLKRRPAHLQRQIQPRGRPLDEGDDLGDELFEFAVSADEIRIRETLLKTFHQVIRIITKRDAADAMLRRRDKDRAERTLADRKVDCDAFAAGEKTAGFMPSIFDEVA